MRNISQRTKNSNCCSVQWLPSGGHKIAGELRLSGEPETLGRGMMSLILVPKPFIREAASTQASAHGNLTLNFTLLNNKKKKPPR